MNQKKVFSEFLKNSKKNYYENLNMNDPNNGKWNKLRQNYIKSYNNEKEFFIREINELNINSIKDIIPKDSEENNFLKSIIKTYLNTLIKNEKNKTSIIKIIIKYFDYIMEKNFKILLNEQIKIQEHQNQIQCLLNITLHSKEILKNIKKKYIKVNVQIFLKKQRLKNDIEIYKVLKKIEKMKSDYFQLEQIVNNDINKSNYNAFNKIKLLLNDISFYKYNNKTLFCFWFSQNLQNLKKMYLNKFNDYY